MSIINESPLFTAMADTRLPLPEARKLDAALSAWRTKLWQRHGARLECIAEGMRLYEAHESETRELAPYRRCAND
jgi:hypothetical protein